ncbi:MAG TPA: PEP-CTERM sorting domain-containing protein [Verrucomicrobiae bacterium]|nr:PEP-CTERM sorting domain-containing protein [Verrucomicrobiae bacterium]
MQKRSFAVGVLVATAMIPVACLAGAFQDLDFEQAQLVPSTEGYGWGVVLTNAFPSWQATVNGSPTDFAIHNVVILDYNTVGIYDANAPGYMGHSPTFGRYSAYLESEYPLADAELAQTGLIPSTAKSIWFATTPFSLEPNPQAQPSDLLLKFEVNGQTIPYVAMDEEAGYTMWAADISAFKGTTSEIRFALQDAVGVAVGLDDIAFSSQVVPEPGTLALVAVSVSLLGFALRRARGGKR